MGETTGGNLAHHPLCWTNTVGVSNELVVLHFLVANDATLECQFAPIRFVWYDCGDNGVSSRDGEYLFISELVYDFAGFVGDYQGIQVLTSGGYGFPVLGWSPDGVNFGFAAEGDVFTLQGFDVPYFLVHFEHHARLFRVEIFDAKGKSWQRAYNEEYLPRNSTATGFFAFPFDGTTMIGKDKFRAVPDGTYYAVISVLKALGDESNPAHWETWTSPMFVIDRP